MTCVAAAAAVDSAAGWKGGPATQKTIDLIGVVSVWHGAGLGRVAQIALPTPGTAGGPARCVLCKREARVPR
jgi:hypothetical protein